MENLTNTNNDSDSRIIYEDEVCVITEHVNYIKLFFTEKIIRNNYLKSNDFSHFITNNLIEKQLFFDCKNVYGFDDGIEGRIGTIIFEKDKKVIMYNINDSLMGSLRMQGFHKIIDLYSTYEEAVEYINKRS
jgi:hypothetical protein